MPIWMITGGSGFLGRHLIARLREGSPADVKLVAIGRRPPVRMIRDEFVEVDLDVPERLTRVMAELRPAVLFHLAGRTPPASPSEFYGSNLLSTIQLLDAVRESGHACRVVMVGSAAELGPVPVDDLPVGEDYPCRPAEAYGLSKWLATVAGLSVRPPIEVVIARVFNPIGPGLPNSQALGRFAEALASGPGPIRLKVGNLDARRDFIDSRDVAEALVALADRGKAGVVYHVGTGRSQRVGDGLIRLIELSNRDVTIEVAPVFGSSQGPLDSRADVKLIARETGWTARIPWEQSLEDLWLDAVERARAGLTDGRPFV